MAEANVTLKMHPDQYNLMMACLEESTEAEQELIDDPAVKMEDKQVAHQRKAEIEALMRQLK
jgi:hypothetical protein